MIATGVKRKPPKIFQVLEFIGHQETSSGCGLMGLGEKMLSHFVLVGGTACANPTALSDNIYHDSRLNRPESVSLALLARQLSLEIGSH